MTEEHKTQLTSFIKEATQLHEKMASTTAEVEKRAPAVVDALVKAGMVDESKRSSVVENLKDPLKVLESLRKSAEYCAAISAQKAEQEKEVAPLGKPADMRKTAGSSASADSRSTADAAFLTAFGLG